MTYIPGSAAPSWNTLYAVNFASLVDQTILADGAQTIDGKTCYALNKANSQTFAVQNGSGLYIRCSTANTVNAAGNWTGPSMYWQMIDLAASMGRFQWQELQMWFQAVSVRVPSADYEAFTVGGFTGAATAGASQRMEALNQYVSGIATPTHYQNGACHVNVNGTETYGAFPSSNTVQQPPNTWDVFMVQLEMGGNCRLWRGNYGADWPAESALIFCGRGVITPSPQYTAGDYRALVTTFSVNGAGNADVLLKKMRILYK